LNFIKYGTYKITNKLDSLLNTIFTIKDPSEKSPDRVEAIEVNPNLLIGKWQLVDIATDSITDKSSSTDDFFIQEFSFLPENRIEIFHRRGDYFEADRPFNRTRGIYLYHNNTLMIDNDTTILSGVTPRGGHDAFYGIKNISEHILTLNFFHDDYGEIEARFMRF